MSIYDMIANPTANLNPVGAYMQGAQFKQQNELAKLQMEQERVKLQNALAGNGQTNEYGLAPFLVQGPNGIEAYQLSKTGGMRKLDVPEGYAPMKQLIRSDRGDVIEYVNPYTSQTVRSDKKGLPPSQTTGYLEESAAAKERGQFKATAAEKLPQMEASAEELITQLDALTAHPGLPMSVGMTSVIPVIPGTPQADFVTRLDQIQGSQFLQAFNSLKGGGTITEVEGKKAEAAIARLKRAQTEPELINSVNEFKGIVQKGLERQRQAAQVPQKKTAKDLPGYREKPKPQQASAGPARISSDAEYNALPSGAIFIGPDGKQRRKP